MEELTEEEIELIKENKTKWKLPKDIYNYKLVKAAEMIDGNYYMSSFIGTPVAVNKSIEMFYHIGLKVGDYLYYEGYQHYPIEKTFYYKSKINEHPFGKDSIFNLDYFEWVN